MTKLFDFDDYKALTLARIHSMPRAGRGEFQKISLHLKMHTTRVSHVFRGPEHLTLEQAGSLCRYFGWNEIETDFYVALVNLNRAGNEDLKQIFRRQIQKLREQSKDLSKRLPTDRDFSEAEKAIFYSQWYYSGIRLLSSIEGFDSIDTIANRLGLSKKIVAKSLEFLVMTGLCIESKGKFKMGPTKTHLSADSPMISRLHANWRLKAIEHYPHLRSEELSLSAPMSIDESDFPEIREILAQAIEKVIKIASQAKKPKTLACLNLDWFSW